MEKLEFKHTGRKLEKGFILCISEIYVVICLCYEVRIFGRL